MIRHADRKCNKSDLRRRELQRHKANEKFAALPQFGTDASRKEAEDLYKEALAHCPKDMQICRVFVFRGHCKWGEKCRFYHYTK